jgi:hypothetical protein
MPISDEQRRQLLEVRAKIWQTAFDAGFSAAMAALSETYQPRKAAEQSRPSTTTSDNPPNDIKKTRARGDHPRLSGDNVRNLILNYVLEAAGQVTAGEFSRRYPHISSSSRYTAARQLGEEGLIVRDNDRWSRPTPMSDQMSANKPKVPNGSAAGHQHGK